MRHRLERYAAVWPTVLTAVAILIAVALGVRNWNLVLTALGVALPLIYFVQSQRREEVRLFKELFTSFNERYDRLNGKLNDIARLPAHEPTTSEHLHTLYDYFNLCGEEYLFNRLGYIKEEAWGSWVAGMQHFYANERIRKEWDRELGSGSYYGFPKTLLQRKPVA